MSTIMLVHGSWHGGWCWRDVARSLRAAGHTVETPTLTGCGNRVHQHAREVGLGVHIDDIANSLFYDDLSEVVLVGHSYAGFVIRGATDRHPERIRRLVYLDAFIPRMGECLFELMPDGGKRMRDRADEVGDGWELPATNAADMQIEAPDLAVWANPRFTPTTAKTFSDRIVLENPDATAIEAVFVHATEFFDSQAARAAHDGMAIHELRGGGHDVMITKPKETASLLDHLAIM